MSLDDIKNKLYKKDLPEHLSEHEISQYDPAGAKNADGAEKSAEDLWAEKKSEESIYIS